jgi:DNA-binding transcriptional MerR regulator
MKRRGNRRYYQHHEVLLIRRIRDLLYEQGFTISGARNRLADGALEFNGEGGAREALNVAPPDALPLPEVVEMSPLQLRSELLALRELLDA